MSYSIKDTIAIKYGRGWKIAMVMEEPEKPFEKGDTVTVKVIDGGAYHEIPIEDFIK